MPGVHGQRSPGGFQPFKQQFPTRQKTKGKRSRGIFGHRSSTGINQRPDLFSQSGKPAFQSS